MQVFPRISAFRAARKKLPADARIGLVPTMGALHRGHASLVKKSVAENDFTIVSIFVNPTQFGPNEDYEQYPRDLDKDLALLDELGVDMVFTPSTTEIYPETSHFYFEIRQLADRLCGRSRPGHMNGVVQVVSILFHLCEPTHAYFGLKDYQQCRIIEHLIRELHFPLKLVPCSIVREADGLAFSSRNVYLSAGQRRDALFLYHTLRQLKKNFAQFQTVDELQAFVQAQLPRYPLVKLDYFEVLHGKTLQPLTELHNGEHVHAFLAAFLGQTRLIDNMRLDK